LLKRFHLAIIILLLFTGPVRADFASEVIDLVNAERMTHGLKPLGYDADLAAAARLHSLDMGQQNYFSHDSQDGTRFFERIIAEGYDYNTCGENIAAGQPTPEAAVQTWMNSSGHRANILNPDFCDIGVGYALVAGSTYNQYWTQDFGRKSGVAQCPDVASPPPGSNDPVSGESGGGCFIDSTAVGESGSAWRHIGLIVIGLVFLTGITTEFGWRSICR